MSQQGNLRPATREQEISQRIPILIIADCEPDPRQTVDAVPWVGFERLLDFVSKQRPLLAAQTRAAARFSRFWRMDPQIEKTYSNADWAVRRYACQLVDAERWGDEIGLHTHAWRRDTALGRWIVDHANRAWIEQCLKTSFEAYKCAFSRACRIFRFGDGWIDEATLGSIENLGVQIDLTVDPGLDGAPSLVPEEASTGYILDRPNVPLQPYHPSKTDFRKPDRDGITKLWIFPVNTGRM